MLSRVLDARVCSLLVALGACAALAGGCGGDADDRPAVWSYLSPVVFQPSCATASCHSEAAAVAGLDFSDPHRGYSSLTRLWVWVVDPTGKGGSGCGTVDDTVVCDRKARPLVTPYDPSESRLVATLRARNAPRMPPDRPLAEADIRLVERWILNGAKGDDGDLAVDASATVDADATAEASSDADTDTDTDGGTQ